jgi:hypothetical protein
MTDWVVSLAMASGKDYPPQAEAYENISSGTDLCMPGSSGDVKNIMRALRRGKIDKASLIKSAARVLALLDHIPEKEDTAPTLKTEAKV